MAAGAIADHATGMSGRELRPPGILVAAATALGGETMQVKVQCHVRVPLTPVKVPGNPFKDASHCVLPGAGRQSVSIEGQNDSSSTKGHRTCPRDALRLQHRLQESEFK
jgi:hypothetical protein